MEVFPPSCMRAKNLRELLQENCAKEAAREAETTSDPEVRERRG